MPRKHQVREGARGWMVCAHVRIAALAALAAACRSQPPPSPAPTSSAPAPTASSPATSEAAPPVAEGGTALSAPSFAAFEEPETDHRTFRHVLVGALIHPPIRLTWVLHRKPDQARLQVLCQLGVPNAQLGMSLTGKENDESIWTPVVETSYVGPRTGEIYALTAAPDATGTAACEKLPEALKLTCKTEQVAVLPAGAALVPGTKRNDDTMSPARWQPATRQRVAALRCDLKTDGAAQPIRRLRDTWPLVFVNPPRTGQAPGPGVEWAFANSDMVVQEGAYRWMASSVLRLRAVRASGDFDAYWAFHLEQEHQRNHVGRYEDGAIPDPLPAPKPRLRRVK